MQYITLPKKRTWSHDKQQQQKINDDDGKREF